MERKEAITKLKRLEGCDLHSLARELSVTILAPNGGVNKGWAGHICERYLGLPLNSAQSPNFGSWELKTIPLKKLKNGSLSFKETMAITMIDPYHVARTPFKDSHLLSKLRKAVIVARLVGRTYSEPTYIHSIIELDLSGELYAAVRDDYELVRKCLNDPSRGFESLTGKMGVYVQPRTKGAGRGSVSRAFYARTRLLNEFIDLNNE